MLRRRKGSKPDREHEHLHRTVQGRKGISDQYTFVKPPPLQLTDALTHQADPTRRRILAIHESTLNPKLP